MISLEKANLIPAPRVTWCDVKNKRLCCYLCLLTFVIQYLLTTDQQEKQLRLYEIIIVTPHTP